MIPFKIQYEKLVNAYMKNEVVPVDPCACFVGNLLNNTSDWTYLVCRSGIPTHPDTHVNHAKGMESLLRESDGTYTQNEIVELEDLFMAYHSFSAPINDNEERLYRAFEATLLRLREIHESKGEVIEEYRFTKRELA